MFTNKWISAFLLSLAVFAFTSCKKNDAAVPSVGNFTQTQPANNAKQISVTPTFSWDAAVNTDSYKLTVSAKQDFTSPVIDVSNLKETSYTSTTLLAQGTLYYWKVEALNAKGSVAATNIGIFFRTAPTPVLPSPGISKYYISPTGEDNPGKGTLSNPWKSLAYAATMVPPSEGDTIYINAGTYVEIDPSVIPIGVNVIGAGEATTILSSSGVTIPASVDQKSELFKLWYDGTLIQLASQNFQEPRNKSSQPLPPQDGNQVLTGFTIDGNDKKLKAGVWVENRNNVTLHHVSFKNINQRGAVFGAGDKSFYTYPAYYLKGIRVYNCTFTNCGKDLQDETLGNLCIAQLDGAEIYNITINDNEGYGIKFIFDGYYKNLKIHDCNITVSESDTKWGEDIAIELWNVGSGNEIYNINCNTWLSVVNHPEMFGNPTGTENMKISNVKLIDKDGSSNKEAIEIGAPGVEIFDCYIQDKGFGIAIWDMGRKNITIRNNIFYNTTIKNNWTGGAAIYIDNSRTWNFSNLNIYNNVFDTYNIVLNVKKLNTNNISDINFINNVLQGVFVADVQSVGTNTTVSYNLLNSSIVTGATSQSNNYTGDPGFLKTGNRWDTYYKPASVSSFVVNKGLDVGLPFKGAAPDIGRYEF